MVAVVCGATAVASDSFVFSATTRAAPRHSSFLGMYGGQATPGVVEQISVASGHVLGVAVRLPTANVTGPYRAVDGALWLTATTGPRTIGPPGSGVTSCPAGGCPTQPDSCAGTVVRIAPRTRTVTNIFRPDPSVLIRDAVPNRAHSAIAYVEQRCGNYWFNQYVVLRDLTSAHEWTIAPSNPSCHGPIGTPSWSADGAHVLFTFAPAGPIPPSGPTPLGTCQQWRRSELAIVPARQNTTLGSRYLTAAPPDCDYVQAAYDRGGIIAVESCGPHPLADRAYVVELTPSRHVVRRLPLGARPDGVSISVDPDGTRTLISEYEAPRYSRTYIGPQVSIWTYARGRLRSIHTYRGLGTGIYVSW